MRLLLFILSLTAADKISGQQNFPRFISRSKGSAVAVQCMTPCRWFRPIKYIGPGKDLIELSDSIIDAYKLISREQYLRLYRYHFSCTDCLDIRVDTSQFLSMPYYRQVNGKEVMTTYESYPVIIENKSDSLYKIGFGQNVHLIVEAMDIDHEWKPIELPYVYKCGTGLRDLYIRGKQVACVLIPVYQGNFNTKLRLRLDNHFSMPFIGTINRSQIKN